MLLLATKTSNSSLLLRKRVARSQDLNTPAAGTNWTRLGIANDASF